VNLAREQDAQEHLAAPHRAPEQVDAALIFAPVGGLIPAALRAVRKGGVVVAGGIHMSDIPRFPYEILRGERIVRSVANLIRADGDEFLALAPKVPTRPRSCRRRWPTRTRH
jgi:alcohol dehydrogenase, propanol-preferring